MYEGWGTFNKAIEANTKSPYKGSSTRRKRLPATLDRRRKALCTKAWASTGNTGGDQEDQRRARLTDHPDGTSTETTGVVSCLDRSLRMVSNGGLGSPLNPNPNMASRTTSYSPAAAGTDTHLSGPHVESNIVHESTPRIQGPWSEPRDNSSASDRTI